MRRVIIESPYAGDVEANVEYAEACMRDCLLRGEAPFASHLLYTRVLDDDVPAHRRRGLSAGSAWLQVAEAVVVYKDRGVSVGMVLAMQAARELGIPIEERWIESEGERVARPSRALSGVKYRWIEPRDEEGAAQ